MDWARYEKYELASIYFVFKLASNKNNVKELWGLCSLNYVSNFLVQRFPLSILNFIFFLLVLIEVSDWGDNC